MTGPGLASGGLLFFGLVLLALALFTVAIRVGRWAIWIAAYLALALALATAFARAPAAPAGPGPSGQRSGDSGVVRSVESPPVPDPGRTVTVVEEEQRVDRTMLDPAVEAPA